MRGISKIFSKYGMKIVEHKEKKKEENSIKMRFFRTIKKIFTRRKKGKKFEKLLREGARREDSLNDGNFPSSFCRKFLFKFKCARHS